MKRSTKIWLTVAGCLVAAGVVFLLIGAWTGGYYTVREWVENGDLSWNFGWGEWGIYTENRVAFDSDYPVMEGDIEKTGVPDAENVEKLSFDVGGSIVEIKISDDGKYYFSSENAPKFQCYVRGDTLFVKNRGRMGTGSDRVITVWIPENESYREVIYDVGGGELSVEALESEEIDMTVGGGEIRADSLTGRRVRLDLGAGEIGIGSVTADQVSVDIGAGEVTISRMETGGLSVDIGAGQAALRESTVSGDADISVGAGKVDFSGTIAGDLDADCSMGAVNFELTGSESDHNYEVDCSMGSVTVGGESIDGMGASRSIDNGAKSDFELDCSMGEISVTFQ